MTWVNGFSGEPLGHTLLGLKALFAYTSADFAGKGPAGTAAANHVLFATAMKVSRHWRCKLHGVWQLQIKHFVHHRVRQALHLEVSPDVVIHYTHMLLHRSPAAQ